MRGNNYYWRIIIIKRSESFFFIICFYREILLFKQAEDIYDREWGEFIFQARR